jgi:ABC-type multidrug transport system ATPase subunit
MTCQFQLDVLPPILTPFEALLFAANLRLPESVPQADKLARVYDVLSQLGLNDVANTRIGSPTKRGISGGEMRRVSIGLELVGEPDVLILDEPTSGALIASPPLLNVMACYF